MRTTFQSTTAQALDVVQRAQRRVQDAQALVNSGKRVRRASDDPTAAATIMRAVRRLRGVEQYRRNAGAARARVAVEERVVDRLTDLLSRAKEIAIVQAGPMTTSDTRAAARAEVLRLVEAVAELGNTRFAGKFLFGGIEPWTAPFSAPGVLAGGLDGGLHVEVGPDQTAPVNHNAWEVFQDSGVLAAFDRLLTELEGGDPTSVAASITDLDSALDGVQAVLADVGARAIRFELTLDHLDGLEIELQTLRSDLEDVELEEAISNLAARETALQAALLTTSRIFSLNLMEYLR